MSTLQYDLVIEPLNDLIQNCQDKVLMGLRLVEQIKNFPEITQSESDLLQMLPTPSSDLAPIL